MSLQRPLIAGVLLLAVSSSALGPPNGTVGTLDFRYPNYIVEPLVRCPYEGYFPHPRDNTWFYRCYRRYDSSFFWRAYFQCHPCTVFSDALDQCVFQETGTQCPQPAESCRKTFEDCRLVKICPAANSNRAVLSAIEVCYKTFLQCLGQPDKPLCQDGFVYDRTNGQCRLGIPNSPCLPDASPTQTPSTTYAPTPSPTTTTPESTSPSTTTTLTPTSLPTTTTIAPITTLIDDVNAYIGKIFVCEVAGFRPSAEGYRTLGCSERQFCNYYGLPLAPITVCQLYLECEFAEPNRLQLVHRQCPAGQFFVYGNVNQCGGQGQLGLFDCPVPSEAPISTTTSPPPPTIPPAITTTTTLATTTTKPVPTSIDDYIDNFFVCEQAGSRPSAEGYRTLGCSERQFCNNYGLSLAPITVCQLYLECEFAEPNRLQLVHRQCPAGQFFVYGNVNQCGGQNQLGLFDCPVPSEAPISTTTSPPPPTIPPAITTTTTLATTTTKPVPTSIDDYIDNFFVCELAGSRPSAEGYRTLGCSERQFCNNYGLPLAPITVCQLYLECEFAEPNRLQLVHRQCPAGQFFVYGNVNQCGGQGQLGWYDCPVPTEASPYSNTTSPPSPTSPPTTTTTTLATTTTERVPNGIDDYIDNFFVCELAGSRPSAQDYRTLGCSERQFCNNSGIPLPRITGCQFYLECVLTAPGILQLVKRQCPEGQFFFYGSINQCGGQGQLGWIDCPVPTKKPHKSTTTYIPPPIKLSTTTTTTTTTTPATTTTERVPTGIDDYIDNFFVCELAGSRPSAEDYRTLGCSERQFCNNSGIQLAPITGCLLYLECEFTAPDSFQLAHKPCPAGQFFFYGNINNCGGQGQLGFHDCHQSTTTTTTTTTTAPPKPTAPGRSVSSKGCTRLKKIVGMLEYEEKKYCHLSCGNSGKTLDSYRYCDAYFEEYICTSNQNIVFEPKKMECDPGHWFDRTSVKCVPKTDVCRS